MSENSILYCNILRAFVTRLCHTISSQNIVHICTSLLFSKACISIYICKIHKIILICRHLHMKFYWKHISTYHSNSLRIFRRINLLWVNLILITHFKNKKYRICFVTFQTSNQSFVRITSNSYNSSILLCFSISHNRFRFSSISTFHNFINVRFSPFST